MPYCQTCASDVSSLKVSPKNHERAHGNVERACGECWEEWLSAQVEEHRAEDVKCMFCTTTMALEDIGKLGRKGTLVRYTEKLISGVVCMNRCTTNHQPFDRETDGRVFTCTYCHFQACFDCDRPEHEGEKCNEYTTRHAAIHGNAEAATYAAFKACPSCKAIFTKDKCGFTQCKCGFRFCSGCLVPWIGVGSVYDKGRMAHGKGCHYRTREKESKHGLKHKFE